MMRRALAGSAGGWLECAPARFIAVMPVIVLLASSVFYFVLFKRWNSAPVFTGSIIESVAGDVVASAVDTCRTTSSKVQVEGWVALKGHEPRRREPLLLVRDPGTGEFLRLKARAVLRPDVSSALNARFSDRIDYSGSGVQGSLNFARAGRRLAHGQIYAGYDTGNGHILVELPCAF